MQFKETILYHYHVKPILKLQKRIIMQMNEILAPDAFLQILLFYTWIHACQK